MTLEQCEMFRQNSEVWGYDEEEGTPCAAAAADEEAAAHNAFIREQRQKLHAERLAHTQEWCDGLQRDMVANTPARLRLTALIHEALHFELQRLNAAIEATRAAGGDQESLDKMYLLRRDTVCSYRSLLRDANATLNRVPAETVQSVAGQGMQLFSSLLPYTDGVAGAMRVLHNAKRCQRSLPAHIALDDELHDLSLPGSQPFLRNTVVGASGQILPLTLAAMPSRKGERIAAYRQTRIGDLQARRQVRSLADSALRPSVGRFCKRGPGYGLPFIAAPPVAQ